MKKQTLLIATLMSITALAIQPALTSTAKPLAASSMALFDGPMCLPGDPCGPGAIRSTAALNVTLSDGPMCFPGDPCGPGKASKASQRE